MFTFNLVSFVLKLSAHTAVPGRAQCFLYFPHQSSLSLCHCASQSCGSGAAVTQAIPCISQLTHPKDSSQGWGNQRIWTLCSLSLFFFLGTLCLCSTFGFWYFFIPVKRNLKLLPSAPSWAGKPYCTIAETGRLCSATFFFNRQDTKILTDKGHSVNISCVCSDSMAL